MRLYNLREGLTAADDALPARFYEEPINAGALTGATLDRDTLARCRTVLYGELGWDERGVPTVPALHADGLAGAIPHRSLPRPSRS
jgi:aldehyde:ferredoxin oxidoreductase